MSPTPKCTTKAKKPLIYKDFRSIFNDKKKTVGRYDCINLLFLIWWGKVDSNHRSYQQQIYSLSPLATREFPHTMRSGAGGRTRTPDLLITNQLLYQLSYTSAQQRYYSKFTAKSQGDFRYF